MNNRSWTVVTGNPIILDFSACKYYAQIHEIIKNAFGFPGYYGKNLDALWDCMQDFALDTDTDTEVQIFGLDKLPSDLREYFKSDVMRVFSRVQTRYPQMRFIIKS